MRIVVLGANGQVASEVCLSLAERPGIQLVPVSRTRLGSAFLRSAGIACRHGHPADAVEAMGLLGDADLVANFVLASGTPRSIHDVHAAVIEHSIALSPPAARIVLFSTLAVYGDPSPGARVRWRWKNAYARDKLRSEQLAVRLARRFAKEVYVLRLGHVTGSLQNISHLIREAVATGPVSIPDPSRLSNTTHIATIADAIEAISAGREMPGTYDLVNVPQWTWREVVEWEAAERGVEARVDAMPAESVTASPRLRRLRRVLSWVVRHPTAKEYSLQALAKLSPDLNRKAQAMNAVARAAREIAALSPPPRLATDAMQWRALAGPGLATLTETRKLLARGWGSTLGQSRPRHAWPNDLVPATHGGNAGYPQRAAGHGRA